MRVERRQHDVSRHRRLDRDRRRLVVADLPDEQDVGVAAQDRPQTSCEGQACTRVDLDLPDSRKLVLHGILDGRERAAGFVQVLEARVERRRLAAPRRSADDRRAVRLRDRVDEHAVCLLAHPERLEAGTTAAVAEDAYDDLLAVRRRQRRYAEVDRVAAEVRRDASVLRQAALGDVEVRHQLQSAAHRGLHVPRDGGDLAQHAVDADAHRHRLVPRLEVDV